MMALALSKELFASVVHWSGYAALVRHTVARRKVGILLYHDPSPDVLEAHFRYLSKRYTFITLTQLFDALHDRDWSRIPTRALVVTLDDGHRGNAELLPVFKRYGVVPTIYLCSQIVATLRHYWFCEVSDSDEWKRLPNAERLDVLRERTGFEILREYDPGSRQALDASELESMLDAVEFGAHTRFHPVLTTCSPDERRSEIVDCKPEIEALTSRSCRHFSYPNGDYDAEDIALAKQAGFRSARTIEWGWNTADTDPFRLRILGVPDDASVDRLAADLSGITGWLGQVARTGFAPKTLQTA
jgi:peptidoglycan/xylan/chitin deacetylase (PgdA/CDA1 family)